MTTPSARWTFMLALLVAGCASNVPEPIRNPPPDDIPVASVQRTPEIYRNTKVRWGGTIASVKNLKDRTQIEIVSRKLDGEGRPIEGDTSHGRFLVQVEGFIDPEIYRQGREVTVSGRVDGTVRQEIGEFPYTYPLVQADEVYLWEPKPPPPTYAERYPYYYDPLWHPYWIYPHYLHFGYTHRLHHRPPIKP